MKDSGISQHAVCPWCRTNEHLFADRVTDRGGWYVACEMCLATGPCQKETEEEAWAAWDAMQVDCFSDLDQLDKDAIDSAIANRQRAPLPPGFGSLRGRILAEICRGWLEMIGKWNGPIQTDEGDETHERVNPTDSPKR